MNPLWLILLVGGGALYFSNLNKTGEKLSITILNLSGLKFTNGAIQFAVNIAIDNPTNTTLTIKQPSIKVFYKENEAGNSIPSGTRLPIKANDRTRLEPIYIQIPFSKLPGIAMGLFTRMGTEQLSLEIEVSTEVNGIPITKRSTISI